MKDKKRTWLWRLRHPDHPQESYLFGTMHVRDRRAFGQWAQVRRAIDTCTAFAAEFRLDELQESRPALVFFGTTRPVQEQLPPHHFRKLRQILYKSVGIDLNLVEHLPPLMIVQLVQERMLSTHHFFALDEYLYRYAKSENKELYGLERLEDQLRLLQSIPPAEQLRALRRLGRNIAMHRRQLRQSLGYYAAADLPRLHRLVRGQTGGYRHRLLTERNYRMAERLAALAAEQSLFAAVGAGHLWGGHGMLRLLKHKGFKVTPVDEEEE